MAITSSLGTITLVSLRAMNGRDGLPPRQRQELTPIQRPGVDGTAFILNGLKGVPFQARAFKTFNSLSDAVDAEQDFLDLIDHVAVEVEWGGITLTDHYKIISIDSYSASRHGSATDGSAAHAEVTLTMIALAAP
jgi:hypothetical protein